jgi:hypothetical protein
MFDIKKCSIQEFLAEAALRRQHREESETSELILFYECERHRKDIWQDGGMKSFEQFLTTHQLVTPVRYRNFVAGLKKVGGSDVAREIGVHATIEAHKIKSNSPTISRVYVNSAKAFREVHEGHVPSEMASRLLRAHAEPRRAPIFRHQSELHRLKAENTRLKAENTRLTEIIKQKNKEIDQLKGKTKEKNHTASGAYEGS